MEKFNANFYRVSNPQLLGKTKRANGGFGSTGVQVIKKAKKEDEIQLKTSESEQATVNSEEDLQVVPEKSEENLQITSDEAVMAVNNEVVILE